MSDLYLKPTEFGGEIEYDSRNDFILTDGLFTSCYIALLSQPFWGNSILPINTRLVSRLTELFENPINSSTRNKAIRYTQEALQFLLDFEIASEIQVDAEIQNINTLVIVAKITEPNGNEQELGYSLNWRGNFIESQTRQING
jgi:phage gp46-like protein